MKGWKDRKTKAWKYIWMQQVQCLLCPHSYPCVLKPSVRPTDNRSLQKLAFKMLYISGNTFNGNRADSNADDGLY